MVRALPALAFSAVVCACGAPQAPVSTPDPLKLPIIQFAGLVTDARTFDEHFEFTDAAGAVHAIQGEYRQIGEHGCCGPLLVLGHDAEGAFMSSFSTQGGLPDDCYVENDIGIDRGSHIEINRVLWPKAPGFAGTVTYGTQYPSGTRFCFDERGRVATLVAR